MDKTDEQLVERFRAGDAAAFSAIVDKYLDHLAAFLFQILCDRDAAEDCAQESFVKVWKNIEKFDTEKSFKAWLFVIAKNTAYDYLRKKKTLPFSFFENEEGGNVIEDVSDGATLAGEILERAEKSLELKREMEKLSLQQQLVLSLFYEEGFSLVEIANILKKPPNTIKSYHRRAILKLREVFS